MLENKLLTIPATQWVVSQVVTHDWYDGPRQGCCLLAYPAVEFIFDLVDEEHDPDGLDMRIVQLKELPPGSVVSLVEALQELGLGPAVKPVWVPTWSFPTEQARQQAETRIETLEAGARSTNLLVSTTDMTHFTHCWKLGDTRPSTLGFTHVVPLPGQPAETAE